MIEVYIVRNGEPVGHIELARKSPTVPDDGVIISDYSDYTVRYAIDRGDGTMGAHSRVIYGFPRKYYNSLALVLQALNALNEKDLKLEREFDPDEATVPADMARRLYGSLREIQAKFSKLHRD